MIVHESNITTPVKRYVKHLGEALGRVVFENTLFGKRTPGLGSHFEIVSNVRIGNGSR
jgi:hypothetical protein